MGLGINPARKGEAHKFELGIIVITRFLAASSRDDAAFHRPDAGLEIEFGCERLGREFELPEVGQESLGVDEDRMAADGLDNGDAQRLQPLADVIDLPDPGAHVIVLDGLLDAARHGLQVAAG